MYLCHGTYTWKCFVLHYVSIDHCEHIQKTFPSWGEGGASGKPQPSPVLFCLCLCMCVCSFKCFIDSSKGKKVLQTILDHLEMTEKHTKQKEKPSNSNDAESHYL